jgi:hypothetical protein
MYSGISNAMVTISRVEGFRTLWKGLSSVVMGAGRSSTLCRYYDMALTVVQGPPTQFISHPTKPQNTLWVVTRVATRNITHLQQVRRVDHVVIRNCY